MEDFALPRRLFNKGQGGYELAGLEAASSLAALLTGEAFLKSSPHLILAAPGDIRKIKRFLEFKPPKIPWLELPPFPRARSAAAKAARHKRIMWQAAARRGQGIFLASPESLLKKTAPALPLILKKGGRIPNLSPLGYREKAFMEEPGDFSQRGFLWDVFSPAYKLPLRLQLKGEELKSISLLSADFKRRDRELEEAWLPALSEWRLDGQARQRLCAFARKSGAGAAPASVFYPQEELLKSLSRGDIPQKFEILINSADKSCSLGGFPRPPWLWIFAPARAAESFEAAAADLEREDPLFARENVFLPWEMLTGGMPAEGALAGDALAGDALAGETLPGDALAEEIPAKAGSRPKTREAKSSAAESFKERSGKGESASFLPDGEKPLPRKSLGSKKPKEGKAAACQTEFFPASRRVFVREKPAPFQPPQGRKAVFLSRLFKMPDKPAGGLSKSSWDKKGNKKEGKKPASPAEKLKAALQRLPSDQVVFAFRDPASEKKLKSLLFSRGQGAAAAEAESLGGEGFWRSKSLIFLKGALEESFFSSDGEAYLQAEEILRALAPAAAASPSSFEFFRLQARALDFSELEEGDLVVHRIHGVGEFSGLCPIEAHGLRQDFFVLLYRDGDRLLLPAHRAREIKRYTRKIPGEEGAASQISRHLLDRLGNPARWEAKKARAKKHIEALTLDLMELYRGRKQASRPPFPLPERDLREFAKGFPFELTPDQKKAVQEIFSDMSAGRPMDRLLCADAGFGKTETALWAAFRALHAGFQVCFLAPTTILSFQHYENFQQRLKGFPFNLALLNRFQRLAEKERILRRLRSGGIDFLIATHGVFSPKVSFKNLGLLIIDEEHRFGVKQKDRLLRLKKNMDTLSLSATPIPRTLNMALSGIKDISVISHPPGGRLPVKTFIESWDGGEAGFLRKACEREKARGGQILFVHNRIKSLPEREEQLKALLPGFRIASAHGRMRPAELESVVLRFFRREFDLLLSTNIIESGLDLPYANTLFIDRVHEMGLSRLYQLKGRVGRAAIQACCYFLIPPWRRLTPLAEERLRLIEKYGEAGGGYRLALHDLEMRGAGALFGAEQSGHLHALGEELYFEILNERLREQKEEAFVEPEIQLPFSTGIPADYISDSRLRLLYYKSLSAAEGEESLSRLKSEIREDFGPFPEEMESLFSLLKIRAMAKALLIRDLRLRELKAGGFSLALAFHEKTPVPAEKIIEGVRKSRWQMESPHAVKIPLSGKNPMAQIEQLLRGL